MQSKDYVSFIEEPVEPIELQSDPLLQFVESPGLTPDSEPNADESSESSDDLDESEPNADESSESSDDSDSSEEDCSLSAAPSFLAMLGVARRSFEDLGVMDGAVKVLECIGVCPSPYVWNTKYQWYPILGVGKPGMAVVSHACPEPDSEDLGGGCGGARETRAEPRAGLAAYVRSSEGSSAEECTAEFHERMECLRGIMARDEMTPELLELLQSRDEAHATIENILWALLQVFVPFASLQKLNHVYELFFESLALVLRFIKNSGRPIQMHKKLSVCCAAMSVVQKNYTDDFDTTRPFVVSQVVDLLHKMFGVEVLDETETYELSSNPTADTDYFDARNAIFKLEVAILNGVGYTVNCAGPHHFIALLLSNLHGPHMPRDCQFEVSYTMACYMCMLYMQLHPECLQWKDMELKLAAAAVCAILYEQMEQVMSPGSLNMLKLNPREIYDTANTMHEDAWRMSQAYLYRFEAEQCQTRVVLSSHEELVWTLLSCADLVVRYVENPEKLFPDFQIQGTRAELAQAMRNFTDRDDRDLIASYLDHPFRPKPLTGSMDELPRKVRMDGHDARHGVIRCVFPTRSTYNYPGYVPVGSAPGSGHIRANRTAQFCTVVDIGENTLYRGISLNTSFFQLPTSCFLVTPAKSLGKRPRETGPSEEGRGGG